MLNFEEKEIRGVRFYVIPNQPDQSRYMPAGSNEPKMLRDLLNNEVALVENSEVLEYVLSVISPEEIKNIFCRVVKIKTIWEGDAQVRKEEIPVTLYEDLVDKGQVVQLNIFLKYTLSSLNDEDIQKLILKAIDKKNVSSIKSALKKIVLDRDFIYRLQQEVLIPAIQEKNEETVKELLLIRDITLPNSETDENLLFPAIRSGNESILQLIFDAIYNDSIHLSRGKLRSYLSSIYAKNKAGKTPVELAIELGQLLMACSIIDRSKIIENRIRPITIDYLYLDTPPGVTPDFIEWFTRDYLVLINKLINSGDFNFFKKAFEYIQYIFDSKNAPNFLELLLRLAAAVINSQNENTNKAELLNLILCYCEEKIPGWVVSSDYTNSLQNLNAMLNGIILIDENVKIIHVLVKYGANPCQARQDSQSPYQKALVEKRWKVLAVLFTSNPNYIPDSCEYKKYWSVTENLISELMRNPNVFSNYDANFFSKPSNNAQKVLLESYNVYRSTNQDQKDFIKACIEFKVELLDNHETKELISNIKQFIFFILDYEHAHTLVDENRDSIINARFMLAVTQFNSNKQPLKDLSIIFNIFYDLVNNSAVQNTSLLLQQFCLEAFVALLTTIKNVQIEQNCLGELFSNLSQQSFFKKHKDGWFGTAGIANWLKELAKVTKQESLTPKMDSYLQKSINSLNEVRKKLAKPSCAN